MKPKTVFFHILSWVMITVIVTAGVGSAMPVQVGERAGLGLDPNSAYFQKFVPTSVTQPLGFNSEHNFARMFQITETKNVLPAVGSALPYTINRGPYYAEMGLTARYNLDAAVASSIRSGAVRVAFSIHMKSWKTWEKFLASNSAVPYATLSAYTDSGWVTIKECKGKRDQSNTLGLTPDGELIWVQVPADTRYLTVSLRTGGSESGCRPNATFEDIQIYMKDDKAPLPVAAYGNGYVGAGEDAKIDVQLNEYVKIDNPAGLTLRVTAGKYPVSTEIETFSFGYDSIDSYNGRLTFKYRVPENQALDTHSFKIAQDSLNALMKQVKDFYGNIHETEIVNADQKVESTAAGTPGLAVDNKPPEIYQVAVYSDKLNPQNGDPSRYHKAGDRLVFGVTMSEYVEISNGRPTLKLNNGKTLTGYRMRNDGSVAYGEFTAGVKNLKDSYTVFAFPYEVAAGDDIARLDAAHNGAALEIDLGTVTDLCGNQMQDYTVAMFGGGDYMVSDVMVDTVAPAVSVQRLDDPSVNPPGGGNTAIFQVEVQDGDGTASSGANHYTVSGAPGMTYFASQEALMTKQQLLTCSFFGNAPMLAGAGVLHYLYVKAPDGAAAPITLTACDAAGNVAAHTTGPVTFDVTAPAVSISHSAQRNEFDQVNVTYTVNIGDGENGSGIDPAKIYYKLLEAGQDPNTEGEEKTAADVQNGQFTVVDTAEGEYNKVLYVKPHDLNNNTAGYVAENSASLHLSTAFRVNVTSDGQAGTILPAHAITLIGTGEEPTDKQVRIAWSKKGSGKPGDNAFQVVNDPAAPADVPLGDAAMQEKFGGAFSGAYELWIQWFDDGATQTWRDYKTPGVYRFSNAAPSVSVTKAKAEDQARTYFKELPTLYIEAYESVDKLPVDTANSYLTITDADGNPVGERFYWTGEATEFEVNPNSIPGIAGNLETGTYTITLHAQSYGGQVGETSIEIKLDREAPQVTTAKVEYEWNRGGTEVQVNKTGETLDQVTAEILTISEMDLKPEPQPDRSLVTGNPLPVYTYWLKLSDYPDLPDKNLKVYYITGAPEHEFLSTDPQTGEQLLDLNGAINLASFKGEENFDYNLSPEGILYQYVVPKEKTLYYREARFDMNTDARTNRDYFADAMYAAEFPSDTATSWYAPISIPIPYDVKEGSGIRSPKSGDIPVSILILDENGNYQIMKTIIRYDSTPPVITASYDNYNATGTGPITASFTATDNFTPEEGLEYSIANFWDTEKDYQPYTGQISIVLDETTILDYSRLDINFRDKAGNEASYAIQPEWFVTARPTVEINWLNSDGGVDVDHATYIDNYTPKAGWAGDASLPYVSDSKMKPAENGFVEFQVLAYETAEGTDGSELQFIEAPVSIAFAGALPYAYQEVYDYTAVPGTEEDSPANGWITLSDGVDLPWLKVTAVTDPAGRPGFKVKVLVPPVENGGINQVFVRSGNDYGYTTIGSLNTWELVHPHPINNTGRQLLLVQSGTQVLTAPDVTYANVTNPVLGVTESVDAALTFTQPVYVSETPEAVLPNDIGAYQTEHIVNYTVNGTHKLYYFDVYGTRYQTEVTVQGIDENIFPTVTTDPAGYTNAASATVTLDASLVEDMYFYNVTGIEGGAGTPIDVGGTPMYKTMTFMVTDNAALSYTVHRSGSGTEYQGSAQIGIFDREAPSASVVYRNTGAVAAGKTNAPVIASLANLSDNTGVENISFMSVIDPENEIYAAGGVSSFTFTKNGSYTFVLKDAAGNITKIPAAVDYIDAAQKDETPPSFRVDYYTQNKDGGLESVGTAFGVDENGVVFQPYRATKGYVLAYLTAVDENPVTVSIDASLPAGVEVLNPGTNTRFRFETGDAPLPLTLKDSAGNETSIILKPESVDNRPPEGHVRYETLEDGATIRATLYVSDNFTLSENLVFPDDANLPKDGEGNRYKEFAANGSYTFVVEDELGNRAEFLATVKLFDNAGPQWQKTAYAPGRPAVAGQKVNTEVMATLTFDESIKEASAYAGGALLNTDALRALGVRVITDGNTVYVICTENIDLTLECKDASGNKAASVPVKVDWIDRTPPDVAYEVVYDVPRAGFATVTLMPGENETDELITPERTLVYTFDEDGTYPISVFDPAGNRTTVSVVIDQLGGLKVKPTVTSVISPTGLTKGDVTITFTPDKDVTVSNGWQRIAIKAGEQYTATIGRNGIYSYNFYDKYNQVTNVTANINNIDKEAPTLKLTGRIEQTFYQNDPDFSPELLQAFTVSDNVTALTREDVAIDDGGFDISALGEYMVRYTVRDEAGNEAVAERKVIVAEKGLFAITVDEGGGRDPIRVVTNGQKIIVNTKACGITFANAQNPMIPVTAKYKAGLLNSAQMKKGTKPIVNGVFTAARDGWYTIQFQDALLNRQVLHLFVSAGEK